MAPVRLSALQPEPTSLTTADTLVERWETISIDPDTLVIDARGTLHHLIEDDDFEEEDEPTVLLPQFTRFSHNLALGESIGRGGTAEVFAARQLALQREVAVKTLRPDKVSPSRARQLIREARVLGALQHPGIVPVHLIATDDQNEPMIVMRRVHGTAWLDFVHLGGVLRAPAGEADPLEWHLRVLMRVCSVAHFAHSQGLIHRDFKLSNVMIGSHGEVYVVDWGMALAFERTCPIDAPLSFDEQEVVGTPGYLAPEMAGVLVDQLRPATDVYLLGGCLHMLLTGEQRHGKGTVMEKLARAWASEPIRYDERVSRELAAIANRACSRDPRDRQPSAEVFRQEIGRFLDHRGSRRLSLEARLRLHALEQVVEDDSADEVDVREIYAEAQFGFRQALSEWSENPDAQQGARATVEAMAAWELRHGRGGNASALLKELSEPSEDLQREVAKSRRRKQARTRRFERLEAQEKDQDLAVGRLERGQVLYVMAVLWGGTSLVLAALHRVGLIDPRYGTIALLGLAQTALVGGVGLRWGSVLRSNAANRRFLVLQAMGALAPMLLVWLGLQTGMAFPVAISILLLLFGLVGAVGAAGNRWLLASSGVFIAGFAASALWPGAVWEVFALTCTAGMLSGGWSWSRRRGRRRLERG